MKETIETHIRQDCYFDAERANMETYPFPYTD